MDREPGDVRIVAGVAGHKRQAMVQRGGGDKEIRDAVIDRPPPVPEIKPYLGDPARDGTADAKDGDAPEKGVEFAFSFGHIV